MSNENIMVVEMSKYQPPKIEVNLSKNWVLNGDANEYYSYIKKCYEDSPTNASIINSISNYIVGEGLIDLNGLNLKKYISKQDLKLIALDYKTYGSFAIQVIWNKAYEIEDKKPIKIKYLSLLKTGLNINDEMEVDGYWYCFDWSNTTKYTPKFFHKFDGNYKEEMEDVETNRDIEILIVNRPSSNDFFPNPDYQAGLVYAEVENELSNSTISHIQNGFQGGAIINCNSGVPATEELKQTYKKKIVGELTGTSNTNKLIVSFNENAEQAMTIDRIDVAELNSQYESFDKTAEAKLIIAHSVPPILFEGNRSGGGFSNNADEIQTATQSLYRKVVHPAREIILEGLQEVFNYINPNIQLEIKDFDSFQEEEVIKENI